MWKTRNSFKIKHGFISNKTDYCQWLLTELPRKTLKHNLFQINRCNEPKRKSHIPHAAVKPRRRLPVSHWIDFKALLLIYKSLHGIGPKYMVDMLERYNPAKPLRSLGSGLLVVPAAKSKQGEVAFSHYAAQSSSRRSKECPRQQT